jgi:hypothetical protein
MACLRVPLVQDDHRKADTHFYNKQIRRIVREMRPEKRTPIFIINKFAASCVKCDNLTGNKAGMFTMLPGTIPRAFPGFGAGRPPAADAIANRACMGPKFASQAPAANETSAGHQRAGRTRPAGGSQPSSATPHAAIAIGIESLEGNPP